MDCCDASCEKTGFVCTPPKSPYCGKQTPSMEELFKYNVAMTVWIRLEFRNDPDEMRRRLFICHRMLSKNRECLDQRLSERTIKNSYIKQVYAELVDRYQLDLCERKHLIHYLKTVL